MAYAEFFVTTAQATTSVTMFGTYGPWIELPDAFPPILWLCTASTSSNVAGSPGLNEGLWIQCMTTACPVGNEDATARAQRMNVRYTVLNFEPGTRWFMLTNSIGANAGKNCTAIGDGIYEATATTGPYVFRLYYRAVGEGPDPRRME